MIKLHKLLERQIKRYLKDVSPGQLPGLQDLLQAVSQAYMDFDSDRELTERSQDLSSRELIAEKQRAELKSQELEEANAQLIQAQMQLVTSTKMSALGEMAGGVAHEINNPLAVIKLRSEQLIDALSEGPVEAEFLIESMKTVSKTADRISKIVKGLRSFARDGTHDPMHVTSIGGIVQETLGFCMERFKNNGIPLEFQDTVAVEVECRSTEISQVLLNLLNNAFDAIQALEDKWVKVTVEVKGDLVELSVIDSGHGIPQDIQYKLMQPFFTTKELGKGTGLGLSISKGIIENHGGALYLDASSPNTRFVISLPKSQPQQKAA